MEEKKQVPQIRFKGYVDAWEQRKLSELGEILTGSTPPTSNTNYYSEDGIPWVTPTDIESLTISDTPRKLSKEGVNIGRVVPANTILCTCIASIGKNTLLTVKGSFNQQINSLTPNEENDAYFLLTESEIWSNTMKKMAASGTMQIVNKSEFSDLKTMIPFLTEQRKIGVFFRQLDNLITLHQRKYDKLVNIKKSMLEKMFPKNGSDVPEIRFRGFTEAWEQRKVGELVVSHNAGVYISKENYGYGVNVIGVGNIYDNDIFNGEIYRLGPVNDDKFLLEENDLIYGESSLVPEGIARTVCVGKKGVGSAFAWHTRRVKLDGNVVNSHFATLELNYNPEVRKYLMNVSTQTALTGMTTEGYFGATLTLPTIDEQKKISGLFQQIDNLITLHQRKLEKFKNIKKSMLDKMFV